MMHRMPGSSLRSPFRMLQKWQSHHQLGTAQITHSLHCANAFPGSSPMHGSVQAYRHPTQTLEQALSLPVVHERYTHSQNAVYMHMHPSYGGTQFGCTTSKHSVNAARGALRTLCDIVRHTYLSQSFGRAMLRQNRFLMFPAHVQTEASRVRQMYLNDLCWMLSCNPAALVVCSTVQFNQYWHHALKLCARPAIPSHPLWLHF
jgi:hypothetical protein